MSIEKTLGHCFKPEVRSRAREDFTKSMGFISNGSDTQIQGYVKAMPPHKVFLWADSISSPKIQASCTCSTGTKGQLCRHLWTLLLMTENKYPDFLEMKTSIAISETKSQAESLSKMKQVEYKKQQSDFRKQQAAKKKQWLKNKKLAEKQKLSTPLRERQSEEVEKAFDFFSINGFSLENNKDDLLLKKAMKQLARIFHPDKGGNHEEAIILNKHYDVLTRYFALVTKPN